VALLAAEVAAPGRHDDLDLQPDQLGCQLSQPGPTYLRRSLPLDGERRKCEPDSENDREPISRMLWGV
jgi:hypothetical protein